MLPPNLIKFIRELISRTNSGEFVWHVDDVNSSISIRSSDFNVDVFYRFNEVNEIGEYSIHYKHANDQTDYRFYTDQYADDEYKLLQALFNAAQGSAAQFPF